jgi:hypothetical protein
MKVGIRRKTCNSNDHIYFLGKYWNEKNKPVQTFLYLTAHIIGRTRFYNKSKLPFPIEELKFHRILSITQDLSNGWSYIRRAFYNWKDFRKFLDENDTYYNLKEWPQETYLKETAIKFAV